ncbi:MAG: methionyl-tRNA formyltransferase [Fidelibacterota bacterium]
MRIVFMGNPAFAVPSLSVFLSSAHQIAAVVTSPDRERGRGRHPGPTPVASFASEHGLDLVQPHDLNDPFVVSRLTGMGPDLFVVVAFKILPEVWLRIPKVGSVNLHGSLLPEYRGAAPIHWALMNGDSVTGLTTFMLAPAVDTGDTLMTKKVVILPDDTLGSLSRRMSLLGARLLRETVDRLESGTAKPAPQDSTVATKAPKIRSSHRRIDWEKHAREVHNLIRALSPAPGAYTEFRDGRLKIFRSRMSTRGGHPGEIISVNKECIGVACGWGSVELLELQLEGKRRMSTRDFLAGTPLEAGEKLGEESPVKGTGN